MKIVFLNVCHWQWYTSLTSFLNSIVDKTDIFCLQEDSSIVDGIQNSLLDRFSLVSAQKPANDEHVYFVSTYISKALNLRKRTVLMPTDEYTGLAIYTEIDAEGKILHLANVHGNPWPGNKQDTRGRLKQSKSIIDFLSNKRESVIVGGDFNICKDTSSVKMFSDNGFNNLIDDFDIKTTRNDYAWRNYPNNKQYYADYTFVKSVSDIEGFSVPNVLVSDHLPMILDINL